MSARERLKGSTRHDYSRAVFTGTFTVWQEFLLEKESVFWSIVRLFDSLLRGFSQVVFANNPISGLLITISLGVNAPGTLLLSAITGSIGLLLSVLIRDSQENIANGLTVLNPLLVGAISSSLIPNIYGPFDGFSLLLIILGTIFSVYLTRSFENNKLPFTAWPFNLAEFALLLVLYTQDNGLDTTEKLQPVMRMDNATSDATTGNISFIGENATGIHIDWGMLKLPILSLPFILVTSLFLQLRNNSEDKTFLQPSPISIPQEQRRDYLANQQLIQQINDPENIEDGAKNRKKISTLDV
ncbi:urea transporter 2 isoform X2 [Bombus fervidus]|uniref:urea transporter 2 isoform X2 n=1 Tax=Bombus fervidus TaxID=203811 RepID=UPI003AB755AD